MSHRWVFTASGFSTGAGAAFWALRRRCRSESCSPLPPWFSRRHRGALCSCFRCSLHVAVWRGHRGRTVVTGEVAQLEPWANRCAPKASRTQGPTQGSATGPGPHRGRRTCRMSAAAAPLPPCCLLFRKASSFFFMVFPFPGTSGRIQPLPLWRTFTLFQGFVCFPS